MRPMRCGAARPVCTISHLAWHSGLVSSPYLSIEADQLQRLFGSVRVSSVVTDGLRRDGDTGLEPANPGITVATSDNFPRFREVGI